MLSVLEDPAIRARVHAFSVEQYHKMIERGAVAANVELIRGGLFEKMSQSPHHASTVEMLREWLGPQLPPDHFFRQAKPLTLADSEPEPDLAAVQGARSDDRAAHPRTAVMVIEVVVSSEALDRLKLELYAEAGVLECWLVFPEERAVERHTEPARDGYRRVERAIFPETLRSTVFPALILPPAGLFAM
jgi:Uma2 family endonuclease